MKPNAAEYNPDPDYFADLVASTGLTQKDLAAIIGCTDRAIRQWCSGERRFSYQTQFTLEALVLGV
jgi:transcriptional regulator with XRE-family HTH domain